MSTATTSTPAGRAQKIAHLDHDTLYGLTRRSSSSLTFAGTQYPPSFASAAFTVLTQAWQKAGLTQTKVAKSLQMDHQSRLSAICNGRDLPSLSEYERASALLREWTGSGWTDEAMLAWHEADTRIRAAWRENARVQGAKRLKALNAKRRMAREQQQPEPAAQSRRPRRLPTAQLSLPPAVPAQAALVPVPAPAALPPMPLPPAPRTAPVGYVLPKARKIEEVRADVEAFVRSSFSMKSNDSLDVQVVVGLVPLIEALTQFVSRMEQKR